MKIEQIHKNIFESIRESVVKPHSLHDTTGLNPYVGIGYPPEGGVRLYIDAIIDFEQLVEKLKERKVIQ